jgi:hypothetical protein
VKQEDAEEYTQSLGQIVSGSWRQIALAKRLGVPQALGLTTETWVQDRLGGYVRMSVEERRPAVKELSNDGYNNVEIGEVLGIDERTVRRDSSANAEPIEENTSNNNNKQPNGSANAEPIVDIAAAAAIEAAKAEANKRETLIRVTEAAFSGASAWAVPAFVDDVRTRIQDEKFRRLLIERLRLEQFPDDVDSIEAGAAALKQLLKELPR